jgi:hypothetical protein
MKRFRKRTWILLGVTVLIAALASIGAYAYWTQGGSGTGSASTGTSSSITVNQTSASTGLYPGGSVALSGDFTNGNASPVYVSSVTASVTAFSSQSDGGKPACTQADFSISGTATVNAQVPVGSGVGSWSGLSLNMTNSGANQDNCKNVSVPIAYTANP